MFTETGKRTRYLKKTNYFLNLCFIKIRDRFVSENPTYLEMT